MLLAGQMCISALCFCLTILNVINRLSNNVVLARDKYLFVVFLVAG